MSQGLEADRWDAEYRKGRYEDEAPIPFVTTILNELSEEGGVGLYVGCGNGRNYIPLAEAGLKLHGTDISSEAIDRLKEKHPEAKVVVSDFADITAARVFDYIVSIQVFQHGDIAKTSKYFEKAAMALVPRGRLFLRVNSTSTEIYEKYHKVEQVENGGFTIAYDSGPKEEMKIHFFSRQELESIAGQYNFDIIQPITEVVEERLGGKTGTWAQFETVWQKK